VRNRVHEGGFTIVEVIIAIVILAVGMLALATTSIFATTQVKLADLKTEQSLAVQQAIEMLRATPFDSMDARAEVDAIDTGSYEVWWTLTPQSRFLQTVTVFTKGPGYEVGTGWAPESRDTFVVELTETMAD